MNSDAIRELIKRLETIEPHQFNMALWQDKLTYVVNSDGSHSPNFCKTIRPTSLPCTLPLLIAFM